MSGISYCRIFKPSFCYLIRESNNFIIVSTSWTQLAKRSCNFWDWDNCTMESLSDWTRQLLTCSEELNHTSPMDIPLKQQSPNLFTREASARSAAQEFLLPITSSLNSNSESTDSSALRTLSMKFPPLDPTSKKQTISCGHSSLTLPEKALPRKDTHIKMAESGATERT